jgi:hypothetical protein
MLRQRELPLSAEECETIAIRVLQFIAADPEALSRFMVLTGLEAGQLRAAAGEPGFLSGVLSYIAGDEALLQAFAASAGLDPARVAEAARMAGGAGEHG